MSRYRIVLLSTFIFIWLLAATDPVNPTVWLLENYPVIIFFPLVIAIGRHFNFSNTAYTFLTIFFILHVIGSHYTYGQVPFGFWLQDLLGSERNVYDRLVHFSFGLLVVYPIREVALRYSSGRSGGFWGFYVPFDMILAFSAVFELIEWGVLSTGTPEDGYAYIGMQGDIWDAQKDIASAGIGAIVMLSVIALVHWKYNPSFWREFWASLRVRQYHEDKLTARIKRAWLGAKRHRK